jgi:hypothetical protein
MGNTYEVNVWVKVGKGDLIEDYKWDCIYAGEDFAEALKYMVHAKDDGIRCVKLEWR